MKHTTGIMESSKLLRRRSRTRDENGYVDEKSRGIMNKKDLEMLKRKKRRRREEREESSEEDYEEEKEVSRRVSMSGTRLRQSPVWKVTEEMIPRKVRSASTKRSSSNGGSGEDGNSPSTSNVSVKEKTKQKLPPKVAKCGNSVQEDIEIEIAEVLYGLMKQSQKQAQVVESVDEIGVKPEKINEDIVSEIVHVEKMEISSPELKKDGALRVKSVESNTTIHEEENGFSEDEKKPREEHSMINTASLVESKREEKLEIDLMAPPPPDSDGFSDFVSDHKQMHPDTEMKIGPVVKDEEVGEKQIKSDGEKKIKRDVFADRFGEKKTERNMELGGSEKLNLANHDLENGSVSRNQPSKTALPDVKKTAQSGLLSLEVNLPRWQSGLPPLGYVPPFPTMASMDCSSGISTTVQPPKFLLSQPPAKRCATHHYIAHNIFYHQQFTKRNEFWSPSSASSPYGAKPYNLNAIQSAENFFLGNSLQESSPGGNIISKTSNVTAFPVHCGIERASEVTNLAETTQRKQLVLQQASQSAPAVNIMSGPTLMFPISQYQPGVAAFSKQSEPPKSASSTKITLPNNIAVGAPHFSSTLPTVPPAMSFYNPNFPVNEAPYMAIMQNNGYSFPVSTHVGNPSQINGGINTHAMPFFNGSFYSPQLFHPSVLQHQQPHLQQHLVPTSHQKSSASSGPSSSHKQPGNQQQTGLQHPQKHHIPSSREDTTAIANAQASYIQKSVYNPNFRPHVQQLNFSLIPSSTSSVSNGPNQGEKQQHQQSSKVGADFSPSRAYNMSSATFNGSSTATSISFSSNVQNHAIFHTLPDISRHGYLVPQSAQLVQQNNFRNEGKSGDSTNDDDKRKAIPGKSSNTIGHSLTFSKPNRTDVSASIVKGSSTSDSSMKTLSFTTASSGGTSSPNSRHHQPIQLQKQQDAKFLSNASISTHSLSLGNTSVAPPQWKSSARASVPQAPLPSLLKNPPHQVRVSQGQSQISFGGQSPSRSQQISIGNHPAPSLLPGSPLSKCSSGNVRTVSTLNGSKTGTAVTTLQS